MTRRRELLLLALIVLTGAGLRLHQLGGRDLWYDEAITVWLAEHDVAGLLDAARTTDQHPPLYYLTIKATIAIIGDGERALRFPSLLFGCATIVLVFVAGRRLLGPWPALFAAAVVALSAMQIQYAQEARMYAMQECLIAAALAMLLAVTDKRRMTETVQPDVAMQRHPVTTWIALTLICIAAALTHSSTQIFFLTAILAFLGLRKDLPSGTPRAVQTALMLGFFSYLLWGGGQSQRIFDVSERFWIPEPTLKYVFRTLELLHSTYMGVLSYPLRIAALALVVFPALAGAWALRRHKTGRSLMWFWLLPLVVVYLLSLWKPLLAPHVMLWTTVPFSLLVAAGVASLRHRPARIALAAAICGVLAIAAAEYHSLGTKEQWNAAAGFVAERKEAGDLVLFNSPTAQLPFDYYARRHGALPESDGFPATLYDRGWEPVVTDADIERLPKFIADHPRVWLVASHSWFTDPGSRLPAALKTLMTEGRSAALRGVTVTEYIQKQ